MNLFAIHEVSNSYIAKLTCCRKSKFSSVKGREVITDMALGGFFSMGGKIVSVKLPHMPTLPGVKVNKFVRRIVSGSGSFCLILCYLVSLVCPKMVKPISLID